MQQKTLVWTGIIVVILLVVGYFYFMGTNATSTPAAQNGTGKVYVTVSDASANVQDVNDVALTINKVELHSTTQGWITVSTNPNTFNLLSLKASGKVELAGEADVPADTYDQVRATIGSVEVKTTNAGTKTAVLASNTLTISGTTVVDANESSHANLDVQTSDSLHTAIDGEFVFTPVVNFESQDNATVTLNSDNSVTATGGTVDASLMVGTDLSGATHVGAEISPNVQIQINAGIPVMVTGSTNVSGSGLINIQSNTTSNVNTSGNVNVSGNTSGGVMIPVGTSATSTVKSVGSGSVNVTY